MCRLKVLISLIIIDIDPAEYLYGQAPFGPGFFWVLQNRYQIRFSQCGLFGSKIQFYGVSGRLHS